MTPKQFEISFNRSVYFGDWYMDGNKLFLEDVHTTDEDGNKIEVDSFNDSELFGKIYSLVEKDKSDEIEAERDYNEWEQTDGKHSKLKDF